MVSFGKTDAQSVLKPAAAILFCVILGGLGSVVTVTGPGSWYAMLDKPSFSPPGWIFAPVWTTLFILMGIALYLVWNSGTERPEVKTALVVFGIQFFLNIIWSFLFFYLRSPFLGLVDILLLWIMIVTTIVLFHRVQKTAAYLLVPYLLWVSFASILNYSVYVLNP